jgi:hypothetical protein
LFGKIANFTTVLNSMLKVVAPTGYMHVKRGPLQHWIVVVITNNIKLEFQILDREVKI